MSSDEGNGKFLNYLVDQSIYIMFFRQDWMFDYVLQYINSGRFDSSSKFI